MKSIQEFLSYLSDLDIKFSADGDRLCCNGPKGTLTPTLRNQIAERKADILAFLHNAYNTENLSTDYQPLPTIVPNPDERHQPFPLTDVQQAYWIGRSGAVELSNVATHVYVEIDIVDLDLERFEKAWQWLIERHDMLRTIVRPDGQQQILEKVPPYKIKSLDLCGKEPEIIAYQLNHIREQMSHQVLPPHQWPLFEIQASLLNENKTRIHLSFDLLTADYWSIDLILRELVEFIHNAEIVFPALELSFRDYVLAEIGLHDSQLYRRSQEYWLHRIRTLPPSPELPLEKSLTTVKHPRFVSRRGTLDSDTWGRLKNRASKVNLTPSGLLLAAFAEILTVWSKNPQFTINLTLFNRLPLHPQVNQISGDFTSLTLLSVDNSGQDSFEVRARRIQKQLWDDFDHRYFSGVQVLRELARTQERFLGALMPIVFTSTLVHNDLTRDTPSKKPSSMACLGEVVYSVSQTPQVYLDHQVFEHDGALVFNWDAVEELFPTGLLDDMFAAYSNFLERLSNSHELWQVTTRELLPPTQFKQIAAINATETPVLETVLLHTLFFERVLLHPEQAAVITSCRTLTYQELSTRACHIGYQLRQLGACPNQLVAIVMEKGWEQVVATLGILAAGAAYVPIDPDLPSERLSYLLKQTKVQWVITQSKLDTSLEWPENVLRLSVDILEPPNSCEPLEPVQQVSDLAYVIFTSGSTGLPKGVMIDHRGAVNTILDINQRFHVQPEDRVIALSSLSFDLSVYDIFGTLAAGGTLIVPDASATRDPSYWMQLLVEYQITIWNSVPALMQMLVEYAKGQKILPKSLRLVMLSGDWLPLTLPGQIQNLFGKVQVVSLGGATEASIWSILYPINTVDPAWKSIPYGCPMTNQRFYVLNKALEPCPVWVPGQLYIGGIGLAKGYWQDDLKTQSSFIIHPRTGERLYKTGDLGRYLPDSNIEFLGREDFQVKINGYRIELGEIEAMLEQHPLVNHTVVMAVGETRENKQLVAYIVSDSLSSSQAQPAPAQQTAAVYGLHQTDGVLNDPVKRLEFMLKQPGLRSLEPNRLSIELIKPQIDEALIETYVKRQSHRQFLDTPISLTQLSELLNCLLQIKLNGSPLPKYRYPSAGSLYPVQTYIYIKPGRVEGLEAGIYYYHPADHRLVLLSPEAEIERRIYTGVNQAIFDKSAFSLFLIGQLSAITPMYGELARDFCLLEAGYMSQLLMSAASASQIGLCPVGTLDFAAIQNFFGLDSNQILLHSFLGGGIDPEKTAQALQPKATLSMATIDDELRSFLQGKLPDYMVPGIYVPLDTLPLTVNGKVDRRALPAPTLVQSKLDLLDAPPQTEVERTIADIVQAVLQVETIGIHSNFFELGANSIHMVQIHSQIKETLGRDIAIVKMFQHPTINFLATHLSQENVEKSYTQIHDRALKQKEVIRQQRQLMEKRKNG
ncbi:non-ribosomal peptide synthetase (plasmid) [Brasilonema octagenarum UFV-E1]|uniref:Non-ribosomal peptide synthetase n=2 Tax=Brasilonema TaxID=383614 RepID=A0A856MMJ2_9CYAN|nr:MULTISPECIES: non-ribosomal peptide synthetase [Brasilonema]NMF62567.1 non-ribosomal peptide synthetase [Brasilonema octagenarum UFV-OR1]QDL12653.1 non-ribosomal peptide synthetase [Brasilonema sennae CENA114]QDL19047.1 non-ribosomal peptide synthetase [Brasilonema octagenarum UFV-E1]